MFSKLTIATLAGMLLASSAFAEAFEHDERAVARRAGVYPLVPPCGRRQLFFFKKLRIFSASDAPGSAAILSASPPSFCAPAFALRVESAFTVSLLPLRVL